MSGDRRITEADIYWGATAVDAGAPQIDSGTDTLRSLEFDDVYFSGDGPAESEHVFIHGNDLKQRFAQSRRFHIGELGFGTGLNFLVAWDIWRKTKQASAKLHFFSLEAFPLSRENMSRAHQAWPALSSLSAKLQKQLPPLHPGIHHLHLDEDVSLTLFYGDAEDGLATVPATIDAWFLDGFSPAKNPAMWSPEIMSRIAERSATTATFSTFTVSGSVRRALEHAGFDWEKRKGFGRKREMLTGVLNAQPRRPERSPWYHTEQKALAPKAQIAVIGGGIAGASLAYSLKRAGCNPSVYEATAPASGASGNPGGLIMPRLDVDDTPAGRFHTSAYFFTLRLLNDFAAQLGTKFFNPCGAFHYASNEKDAARQSKLLTGQALPPDWLKQENGGVFFPQAGVIDPVAFVCALLGDTPIIKEKVTSLKQTDVGWLITSEHSEQNFDAVIIANGLDALRFAQARTLPLTGSAGQIEWFPDADAPSHAHAFGPYAAPAPQGGLLIGATYAPIEIGDQPAFTNEATRSTIAGVARQLPELAATLPPDASQPRASIRCTTPDRLPVVGPMPDWGFYAGAYDGLRTGRRDDYPQARSQDGLFILSGLGSRGLVTGPLAAEMIAAQLTGCAAPADTETYEALHPARFFIREMKRAKTGRQIS